MYSPVVSLLCASRVDVHSLSRQSDASEHLEQYLSKELSHICLRSIIPGLLRRSERVYITSDSRPSASEREFIRIIVSFCLFSLIRAMSFPASGSG